MRAILSSFDNFMIMFVAAIGVMWSTVLMPLLGGPLHPYEMRAIGAGWQSIQSGQAASLNEAFEIATSFPAEAVFPSAHAAEFRTALAPQPVSDPLELLGGPQIEIGPAVLLPPARRAPRVLAARTPPPLAITVEPLANIDTVPEIICDAPQMKQDLCEVPQALDVLRVDT